MIDIIKIMFACFATVVALAILIVTILMMIGLFEVIEIFMWFHFTIGAVLVFVVFWPFYSKKLK